MSVFVAIDFETADNGRDSACAVGLVRVENGVITKKEVSPTANPFKTGDHVYLLDYKFKAPAALLRGQTQPGQKQLYNAQIKVDAATWGDMENPLKSGIQVGQLVHVKYETTYPDINGIDKPDLGLGCGPGSNLLSGWLLFDREHANAAANTTAK